MAAPKRTATRRIASTGRRSAIRQRLSIPVIANGEIWDYQSAQDCLQATGCDAIMLGRGALNVPNLSRVVKYNEPRSPAAGG